jgi:hypothetical protein
MVLMSESARFLHHKRNLMCSFFYKTIFNILLIFDALYQNFLGKIVSLEKIHYFHIDFDVENGLLERAHKITFVT